MISSLDCLFRTVNPGCDMFPDLPVRTINPGSDILPELLIRTVNPGCDIFPELPVHTVNGTCDISPTADAHRKPDLRHCPATCSHADQEPREFPVAAARRGPTAPVPTFRSDREPSSEAGLSGSSCSPTVRLVGPQPPRSSRHLLCVTWRSPGWSVRTAAPWHCWSWATRTRPLGELLQPRQQPSDG